MDLSVLQAYYYNYYNFVAIFNNCKLSQSRDFNKVALKVLCKMLNLVFGFSIALLQLSTILTQNTLFNCTYAEVSFKLNL